MNYKQNKILAELINHAETNEEKEKIFFEWIKENRKNLTIKQLIMTLGTISSSLLSMLIILICKEIIKK